MGCLPPQPLFIRLVKSWGAWTTNLCCEGCEEGMWLAFDLNILRGASVLAGVAGAGGR
jgi:hypothetical protein